MQGDPLDRLKALKGQMAPTDSIDPLERLKASKAAAGQPVSRVGQLQGGAETLMDASTLGVSGLVGDLAASALPWEPTFKQLRSERQARRASVPSGVRIPLEVAGAVATPLPGAGLIKLGKGGLSLGGALVEQAPQTAGFLARTGRAMGDAALQGGIAGAANNLNDLTPEAAGQAAKMGLLSAGVSGGIGALLGSGTEIGVRALRRLKNIGRLDKAAFGIADDMAKLDKANYGAAAGEATSTQPVRDVLESKTVKPFADIIRGSEKFQNADDATVLMESYKLMSQAARRAEKSIEGSTEHQARQLLQKEDIGLAKGRMLDAAETPSTVVVPGRARTTPAPSTAGGGYGGEVHPSVREGIDAHRTRIGQAVVRKEGTVAQQQAREALDRHISENVVSPSLSGAPAQGRFIERPSETVPIDAGIPSLRNAINVHRTKAGELDALSEAADMGLSVGRNKSIPGAKLLTQSREAYLRNIPKMTNAEAEAALAGVMGRFPEQVSLTSSPLGVFGLVTSAVRSPLLAYRTMPIIRALEAKLGRGNLGQGAGDLVRGTSTRLLSSLFRPDDQP